MLKAIEISHEWESYLKRLTLLLEKELDEKIYGDDEAAYWEMKAEVYYEK